MASAVNPPSLLPPSLLTSFHYHHSLHQHYYKTITTTIRTSPLSNTNHLPPIPTIFSPHSPLPTTTNPNNTHLPSSFNHSIHHTHPRTIFCLSSSDHSLSPHDIAPLITLQRHMILPHSSHSNALHNTHSSFLSSRSNSSSPPSPTSLIFTCIFSQDHNSFPPYSLQPQHYHLIREFEGRCWSEIGKLEMA